MIEAKDILLGLEIAAVVLLLVALYHVIFVVVDLRKIMRRVEEVSSEVEDVIMKPLSMVDRILQWVMEMVESHQKKMKHGKKE
jgi:cell shape-determining protein MreC